MTLAEMLSYQPPIRPFSDARRRIRERISREKTRLVVVDDDPTGTQTVHDVPVYLSWDEELLAEAIRSEQPLFFVSTNSRALNSTAAVKLAAQLGENLQIASRVTDCSVTLCSRSDSTLRGHYPYEVEAMCHGLGIVPDGVLIAPAFFEGGRYTIDDVHWVEQGGSLVPAHETEFARDPSFGFRHSDLKLWVEEKTKGRHRADKVLSVSLTLLRRGGAKKVSELLRTAENGQPIVANATCYEDLEILAMALLEAEAAGSIFTYRTAASFVKVRGGIPDRPLLGPEDLGTVSGAGLIIVGSYVQRTTVQLEKLLASGLVTGIELEVSVLLDERGREKEIERVKTEVERNMAEGRSVAVYTSRRIAKQAPETFLTTGNTIMGCLCRLVQSLETEASFIVAKGGITSIELARSALGLRRAMVLGQIIAGVPVWRLGSRARWKNIPYIVFPGNVGDDQALRRVVEKLLFN